MSNGWNILHNRGNDSMYFIDLIEVTHNENLKGYDAPRTSSFGVSKNYPGCLSVIGVLDHNYYFKPKTGADRDKLVTFLERLEYTS